MTLPAWILSAAFAVAALSLGRARLGIGSVRARLFAPSAGSAGEGITYAFTAAFLPWAKESARGHPLSYLAGIVYHAGILAMLICLVLSVAPLQAAPALAHGLAFLFGAALAAGLGLLVKRLADSGLRAVSVPDDFIANLLVDGALAAALAAALLPAALFVFQLWGAALLAYAPLGKLRHMLFLLTSRRLWGAYYGRRGVLP